MRRIFGLVGAGLLLAGCTTVVDGSPVADPSAVPKPDVGSFATSARTLSAPTQRQGLELEGFRMAETVPPIYEIDPELRYRGRLSAGSVQPDPSVPEMLSASVRSIFGDAADRAFGIQSELGVMVGASALKQGARAESGTSPRGVTVAVIRLRSPEAAAQAVGPALLAGEKDGTGKDTPKKVATSIPGHGDAVAYTQDYGGSTGKSTIAYLAHKQFVLGVYGDFSTEQIRTFFDRQAKGLDGFTPTPLDRVTTLPRDAAGVGRLTLAPSRGDGGYSVPARVAILRQSEPARSATTFDAAGVDVVGSGSSTVYRARDEKGAQHVAEQFLDETRNAFTKVESETVKGVPGATCLTYSEYATSTTRATYCVVPVGRYLAEFGSPQHNQAVQAIGASYLILRDQK